MAPRNIPVGFMLASIACFAASRIDRIEETWINAVLNGAGVLLAGYGLYRLWRIGRQGA